MNLTLHLTNGCNMDCSYCTQEKGTAVMTEEVLYAACELAYSGGPHAGFCFFGGEPLLCEELIYKTVERCTALTEKTGKPAFYRMTTNGTLLTADLTELAVRTGMKIGLSFDGLMQDSCRRYRSGAQSFSDVLSAAERLLAAMPDTTVMMTVAPGAAELFAESVRFLYRTGFRSIHAVPAYGNKVSWDEEGLELLRGQLEEISAFYIGRQLEGGAFSFSPFDTKIRCLLDGRSPGDNCRLGSGQMPVAPDGRIYACNQFIGDEAYCLGDVFSGISHKKCSELRVRRSVPERCRKCWFRTRCLNTCGCLNTLETGNASEVSEFQCSYERMLIRIADRMAEELIRADREGFERRFRG